VETADNVLKTVFITTTDPGEIIQELPMYRKDLVSPHFLWCVTSGDMTLPVMCHFL